jgi:predicted nucleic acid-binding protein
VSSTVFVDTSGWLAAINTRDSHYHSVVTVYDDLVAKRTSFVTSNLVVAEMHILIVRDRGAAAGCALLDAIYTDPLYRVVTVDRDLESEATERWLRRFTEQRFSLADAVSFEIMRRERIGEALALDHHFEVAGYRLLPGSDRKKPPARRKKGKTR